MLRKTHHRINYLQSLWNRFHCRRINDLLRLVNTHNFHWIFVLLTIFCIHEQLNGFLSSQDFCRQAILSTSTKDCQVETSMLKLIESEAETSEGSSFTKLANYSSSWSSTWTSGHSCQIPNLWKPLITAWSRTSSHADLIHEIVFKMSTPSMMPIVFTLLLILEIANVKSFCRYLTLEFLIIPMSRCWSLDVVFFVKKTTLTIEKRSLKLFGLHGASSISVWFFSRQLPF